MADSKIVFTAFGHKNVLLTHRTTLEFTKHSSLTKKGDCIVGVKADFSLEKIKKFFSENPESKTKGKKIVLMLRAGNSQERITAVPNRNFSSEEEMVIRKGEFISERTFATNSDKAAKELSRDFVEKLKSPLCKIYVEISFEK